MGAPYIYDISRLRVNMYVTVLFLAIWIETFEEVYAVEVLSRSSSQEKVLRKFDRDVFWRAFQQASWS